MNEILWLDKVEIIKEPIPHIKEKQLMQIMPEYLKPEWERFIFGQTGLMCDDGDFGIYSWDFDRFANRFRENKKNLQDSVLEWD